VSFSYAQAISQALIVLPHASVLGVWGVQPSLRLAYNSDTAWVMGSSGLNIISSYSKHEEASVPFPVA